MTTREMLDCLRESYEDLLLADGFEDALVGIVEGATRQPVACYDYERCVQILIKTSSMTEEEAEEFMDYNVTGAYMGPLTPLFLHDWRDIPSYEAAFNAAYEAARPRGGPQPQPPDEEKNMTPAEFKPIWDGGPSDLSEQSALDLQALLQNDRPSIIVHYPEWGPGGSQGVSKKVPWLEFPRDPGGNVPINAGIIATNFNTGRNPDAAYAYAITLIDRTISEYPMAE